MSTNARRRTKSTDPRPNYYLIGTDADGYDHLHRTKTEEIVVVEPWQGIVHTQPAPDIDRYADAVREQRGWADERYGLDLGELLGTVVDLDEMREDGDA